VALVRLIVPLVSLSLLAAPVAAQPLTPEQAVARALGANPTRQAAEADVRAAGAQVRAAEGARVPVLVVGADGQVQESFSGTSRGVARNSSSRVGGTVALRYTTELGTQIEVAIDGGAAWRAVNLTPGTTDTVTIGPNYSAQARVDARQPLLRGAGDDATLGATRQAEAARTAAERSRDQTMSQIALDTLSAYWELWYAQQAVRVQEEALALATQQHEAQRLRVEQLGTAAPADLLQLAQQRASISESLALAHSTRETRAIALGRLLGMSPEGASTLVASGDPPEAASPPPVSRLASLARDASSELMALRAQIDGARQRVRSASDADQPRLDLLGSVAVAGLWNETTIDGLQLPGDRPAFGGLVGLELELPLGTSQAAAEHEGARADLEAAEARYLAREQELVAELAAARVEVETSGRQIELANETARLARQLASAESERLAIGTTTPLALVVAQQGQRESELRTLRAIVDRVTAELGLAHRTGQLLVQSGTQTGAGS
jgi:outer membrane protein TolC